MKQIVVLFACVLSLHAQSFHSVVDRLRQVPVDQRQEIIERYLNSKRTAPIIENDSVVHFVLYGTADSVSVNGNLQHWLAPDAMERIDCGMYALFHRSYVVPPDSRLDYQLIINGTAQLDPQNPSVTPSGFGPHSEVRMPKFVSSAFLRPRPGIPRGMIDSLAPVFQTPSPLKRYAIAARPVKVYRPAGYDTLNNLPSVYVFDGFETIDYSMLPTVLDNLIAEGKIPPVIAVFVPPVERYAEYYEEKRGRFVHYLAAQVMPVIDALYRTDPSPQRRAVMGISAGGHIALYFAFRRPDLVRNVAGQSSAITPWLQSVTTQAALNGTLPPDVKIYLDCGRYDIKGIHPILGEFSLLERNRQYSQQLSSLRIPHYYKEWNDGHEWANWRERMPDILQYFFGTPR